MEDYSWIHEYTSDYLVYNKGAMIVDSHVVHVENIGGNQRDILDFIVTHYYKLPQKMVFVQANPFDHCRKDVFSYLVKEDIFTPLEYYGSTPANGWERRDHADGYMELNNSWYIQAHNQTYNQSCKYSSFDEFMRTYFSNYTHLDWIRFAPGSQYVVTKQDIKYTRSFWLKLRNELYKNYMTEAHIIERALWLIFMGIYEER